MNIEHNAAVPVYFATGPTGDLSKPSERYIYFCVPSKDYYEYITVLDSEIALPDDVAYAAWKKLFLKLASKGYLEDLASSGEEAKDPR